ncbi:MAG: NAD(P)/FAD-dependent oxidoreductase [Anaerolineales bacterium]|nr:NAD(P)/FAD-dependent oxidoreductase [Anaerolineales bacterium]
MKEIKYSLAVIGAGPAGLTAAYQAARNGIIPIVFEKRSQVGGIARTESYNGYRFDIGGHRYFTKVTEVDQLWHDMMGEDFLKVSRLSRIYYQDRFFKYPLDPVDALTKLGLVESFFSMLSFIQSKIRPFPAEESIEHWVSNRFGRRLFRMFFKTYTEKVWGVPCDQIQADWAAQRIKGLSFTSVVTHALFHRNVATSLINEFHYPILGPGMMWQRFQEAVQNLGGSVMLESAVERIERQGGRITGIVYNNGEQTIRVQPEQVISSMPLTELVDILDPSPPEKVLQAASGLLYRDFILVVLIVDRDKLFPDNWIYVHSPQVKVGRIQNFKNWSAAMVNDPQKTSLGMEYFCNQGDEIWQMSDDELVKLAAIELEYLGLAGGATVVDSVVIRQLKTYPVYNPEYNERLEVIREYIMTLENLQTIGRNGMHRYNNMDHSMLTGMLAVRNLLGEKHDLWKVNTEQSYHEEKGHV